LALELDSVLELGTLLELGASLELGPGVDDDPGGLGHSKSAVSMNSSKLQLFRLNMYVTFRLINGGQPGRHVSQYVYSV
jgi:hypothetical protein